MYRRLLITSAVLLFVGFGFGVDIVNAQAPITIQRVTTTLSVSICGDFVVNDGEECDVPGETGEYSTTIAGRQCNLVCDYGPYCGDGVLQTLFGEECDDSNNVSGDFCSETCTIEVSGSGGGGIRRRWIRIFWW